MRVHQAASYIAPSGEQQHLHQSIQHHMSCLLQTLLANRNQELQVIVDQAASHFTAPTFARKPTVTHIISAADTAGEAQPGAASESASGCKPPHC